MVTLNQFIHSKEVGLSVQKKDTNSVTKPKKLRMMCSVIRPEIGSTGVFCSMFSFFHSTFSYPKRYDVLSAQRDTDRTGFTAYSIKSLSLVCLDVGTMSGRHRNGTNVLF